MGPILAALLLLLDPDDGLRRLDEIRRSIREKKSEAVELKKSAHEELDRGEYEAAVGRHRRARDLEREMGKLKEEEGTLVEEIAAALLPLLDDDSWAARERASAQVLALGPRAIPFLDRAQAGRSVEARTRLGDALGRLRLMAIDEEGRLRQWAVSARASSEYTSTGWSAMQATGKPDTEPGADARTAWASLEADAGEEWLELGYDQRVCPTHVRMHETFNPGAVSKVEAQDADGKWHILWKGQDPTLGRPGWFTVAFERAGFATRAIRITLDSAAVPGWNEIDAVELIGDAAP